MLHVPFTSCRESASPLLPPLTAADYLRLRREAAKLSVPQVAAAIAPEPRLRGMAAGFIRLIEKPNNRVIAGGTLLRLQSVFPLDPAVYQQLLDEPADRHPQICRGCGCSHWDPCDTDSLGPCAWSTPDMCTRCAPEGEVH
jgi:hypothetical protein